VSLDHDAHFKCTLSFMVDYASYVIMDPEVNLLKCIVFQDFGDTIPGHGGLVDRFDCQFLMATFVYVYHSTFIR